MDHGSAEGLAIVQQAERRPDENIQSLKRPALQAEAREAFTHSSMRAKFPPVIIADADTGNSEPAQPERIGPHQRKTPLPFARLRAMVSQHVCAVDLHFRSWMPFGSL